MLQWFIRFPEFAEFNESSAPFRKNSTVASELWSASSSSTKENAGSPVNTHWRNERNYSSQVLRFSYFELKVRLIRLGFSFQKQKFLSLNAQPTDSQSGTTQLFVLSPWWNKVKRYFIQCLQSNILRINRRWDAVFINVFALVVIDSKVRENLGRPYISLSKITNLAFEQVTLIVPDAVSLHCHALSLTAPRLIYQLYK